MRVEAPAADHVTPRARDRDASEAREQRPGEQERGADLAAELRIEIGLLDRRRIDTHVVRTSPLDARADMRQEIDHRLDIADARHVREADLVAGEEARSEDRERSVLVPGCPHRAREGAPALDHERLHGGQWYSGHPRPPELSRA